MKKVLLLSSCLFSSFIYAQTTELLGLEELSKKHAFVIEEETEVEGEIYVLSVDKASMITEALVERMPNIQELGILELDSMPACVSGWKNMQLLNIHTVKQQPFLPEKFANYFPHMKELSCNIYGMLEGGDVFLDRLLSGEYKELTRLNIMAFNHLWNQDGEKKATIEEWELPKQAEGWTSLKWLKLRGVTDFGEYPKNWTSLESVTLRNYVGKIDVFNTCSKLTDLEINGNCPYLEQVGQLKSLKTLELFQLEDQEKIPESIGQLTNLEEWEILFCSFEQLPSDLSKMKKLTSLVVLETPLSELPNTICDATSLMSIFIHHSNIEALPEAIGQLNKLEELYVIDANLQYLPASIVDIPALIVIDFTGNQIEELPKGEYKWQTNIETISFERNQLKKFSNSFIEYLKSINPNYEMYDGIWVAENNFKKKEKNKVKRELNQIVEFDVSAEMW